MKKIIDELNLENGSNYKLSVLKKYQDNQLLQQVLKMTYDKVKFTYGISMKNIPEVKEHTGGNSLIYALTVLEVDFVTRNFTGNNAIDKLHDTLSSLSKDDAFIIEKIIDRDLKINVGRTTINKVWKNLITKPCYMRCGTYSEKTAKKISFPAIVQEKSDGRFVNVIIRDSEVLFMSRSGEEDLFPEFSKNFINTSDGVYIGELLVQGIDNRGLANGMINSDNPPEDKMYIQFWDNLTLDEWDNKKSSRKYLQRFTKLKETLPVKDSLKIIETHVVENIQEALKITSKWMSEGKEGSILKDCDSVFKDGTSTTQLKLKLEIDCEVRITGFTEGKKGTKREKFFGAITYENDEGSIKGQCSGFSDKQLEDFNSRRNELIGQVMTVQFNDLSKAQGNAYYALSHPRFIELRGKEKNETDSLEKVYALREMAMQLGENK